jgi:protein phosphatase
MMRFAGESHVGCEYEHNEDVIGWVPAENFWFLADGMGGYAAGEVASGIVKRTLLKEYAGPDSSLSDLADKAHAAVVAEAKSEAAQREMGSTLVMLRVSHHLAEIVWVGDSRAYLWRHGELDQINRDHSVLEQKIKAGEISRSDAYKHERANELTQALGFDTPEPERIELELESQDWIIMCTDGLHDHVPHEVLVEALRASELPAQATQALIQAALAHSTDDNVSVIVVECP